MHEAAAPGPRAGPAALARGGGLGAIVRRAQAHGRHLPPWLLRTRGLVQRRAALRGRTQPPRAWSPSPSAGWCVPGPWCAVGCAGSVVHGRFVWCTVAVRGARSRSWVHGRCAWRMARGLCARSTARWARAAGPNTQRAVAGGTFPVPLAVPWLRRFPPNYGAALGPADKLACQRPPRGAGREPCANEYRLAGGTRAPRAPSRACLQ